MQTCEHQQLLTKLLPYHPMSGRIGGSQEAVSMAGWPSALGGRILSRNLPCEGVCGNRNKTWSCRNRKHKRSVWSSRKSQRCSVLPCTLTSWGLKMKKTNKCLLLISHSSCIYLRFFKARTGEIVTQMDFACEVGTYTDLLIPNRKLERKQNLRTFSNPKVCAIMKPIYKQMFIGKKISVI